MIHSDMLRSLKEIEKFIEKKHEFYIEGFKDAVEILGREGDLKNSNWSEPYEFLKERSKHL